MSKEIERRIVALEKVAAPKKLRKIRLSIGDLIHASEALKMNDEITGDTDVTCIELIGVIPEAKIIDFGAVN